jgi:hypothetical protein
VARIRTLKPEFCTSKDVAALSRDARLFFLQLLTEADDEGRLLWIPRRLCGVLYPHDDDVTSAVLEGWAGECSARNMVAIYDTPTHGRVLQVVNFLDHQAINRPSRSRLPESSVNAHGGLTEPSVNAPASLTEDSRGEQGTGKGTGNREVDSRSPHGGRDAPDGFEGFWRCWPKKVARADAEKVWRKLRPDAATQVLILGAVSRQARSPDWTKDDGKFIPHPATWLNGRRWEDEVGAARSADGLPTLSAAEFAS